MTATKSTRSRHATGQDTSAAVDAFMAGLPEAQRAALEPVRAAVLAADPSISEGIKWNAPSFRTHEYFATFHLRGS